LIGDDSFQTMVWSAADKTFHAQGSLISIAAK
jgi:hypothetical protein